MKTVHVSWLWRTLVTVAAACTATAAVELDDANPLLTIADIAGRHGYDNVETHHPVTDDGFILQAFKFPHKGPGPSKGVVVFLSGWLCQVAYFLVNTDAAGSIPYYMVDQGYTVWMMNHRNKPFPNHTTYKETDPQMWNYTNEDMIYNDIPTTLNYIKANEAGQKMTLVGHSRGGFFTALFAADPRSKDLLNAAVLIGGTSPEVKPNFLEIDSSFQEHLAEKGSNDKAGPGGLACLPCGPKDAPWPGCCGGIGPLVVADPHVRESDARGGPAAQICRDALELPGKAREICTDFTHIVTGGNGTQDPARMPMEFAFYPSYESVATQNVANIPFLDIKAITVPVIIFAGEHDKFVPLEVGKLVAADMRKHGKLLEFVELKVYGHVDEIAAIDCGIQVGGRLDKLLEQL